MFKKILIAVLIFIFIVASSHLLRRYIHYKNDKDPDKTFILPKLVLSKIEITNLTKEKTDLLAQVKIRNPLPFGFKIDSLAYRVYIRDTQVVKSIYQKSVELKKSSTSEITLPVSVFNKRLSSVLKNADKEELDTVDYKIKAVFFTDLLFRKKWNFEKTLWLPLIHLLEVKVDHVDADTLNLKGASLTLHALISNRNVYNVNVKNISYKFAVGGNQWIKGEKEGILLVPAKSKTEVTLPMKISFGKVFKTLYPLIKEGKNIDYKLEVKLTLNLEQKLMKNSMVVLENSGTLKEIMKLAKKSKTK